MLKNKSSLKLGGEKKNVSVLFSDIRNFTTITENLKDTPEKLVELINRVLGAQSQAIFNNNGAVDKYIGDAVMAWWNGLVKDIHHADNALTAALDMNDAIRDLDLEMKKESELNQEDHITFKIGIGINTGDAIIGNMGSDLKMDFSAIGDAVNLAARLESATKEYGLSIIYGENTESSLSGKFISLPIDIVQVKGKKERVRIFTTCRPEICSEGEATLATLREIHYKIFKMIDENNTEEAINHVYKAKSIGPDLFEDFYDKIIIRIKNGSFPERRVLNS